MASKVDYLAEEYSQLLLSQLDEQRAYFGTLHEKQAKQAEATLQESKAHCKSLEAATQNSAAKAQALERKCKAAESKLVGTGPPSGNVLLSYDRVTALRTARQYTDPLRCTLIRQDHGALSLNIIILLTQAAMTSSLAKAAEDRDFLKELNHQLELNQLALQKKCATLEEITRNTVAKKNEELADLREQVEGLCSFPACTLYSPKIMQEQAAHEALLLYHLPPSADWTA